MKSKPTLYPHVLLRLSEQASTILEFVHVKSADVAAVYNVILCIIASQYYFFELKNYCLRIFISEELYFSADDWQCSKCGNVNWARRQQCNMCNAPKFGEIEERTGYGGGYNDRGVVEYKERRDEDDEYDEFGRRKKKRKLESRSDDDSKDSKYSSPSRSKSRDKDERDERDKVEEDEQAEENVIYHNLRLLISHRGHIGLMMSGARKTMPKISTNHG